eukprot:5434717-Prymnesium_polylepis.1
MVISVNQFRQVPHGRWSKLRNPKLPCRPSVDSAVSRPRALQVIAHAAALLAARLHVHRVALTLALLGPQLAINVSVVAIDAHATALLAIRVHESRVLLALASL